MKKVLLFIVLLSGSIISAQVPGSFNYQAIPRDVSGEIYPNQTMNVMISIIADNPGGSSVYIETFNPTTTSLGLLNLQIGQGTPVSGTFSSITWGSTSYYLKVEIDPTGGTSYINMGTTQLISVPYAFVTDNAFSLVGADGMGAGSNLDADLLDGYDSGDFLQIETDPVFTAYPAYGIEGDDITDWNSIYWSEIKSVPSGFADGMDNDTWTMNTKTSSGIVAAGGMSNAVWKTDATGNPSWDKIVNSDISSSAEIDATKIADGSVTNTAFQYIHNLTSNAQTQLDGKADISGQVFTGDISATNLSGTNTGDQNLTEVLTQGTDAGNKSIVNISQQGIGTSIPDASAALDITSTTKGFLPPRLTTVEIKAILRPAEGLVVYNLDTKALNVFDGTMWADMTGVDAFPLELGDTYAGGIIFYIDGTGKHGLVCASTDQSSLIQWYNNDFYSTTGATGTAVGTGQSNTTAIVTDQGEGSYAAILCDDLVLNTFSDWFLPSKDELDLMYTNLKLNGFGGFTDEFYWSSSEESVFNAWSQYFGNGDVWIDLKSYHYFVRAVRAF